MTRVCRTRHHVAVSATMPIGRVLEQLEWPVIPVTPPEALIQELLSAITDDLAYDNARSGGS